MKRASGGGAFRSATVRAIAFSKYFRLCGGPWPPAVRLAITVRTASQITSAGHAASQTWTCAGQPTVTGIPVTPRRAAISSASANAASVIETRTAGSASGRLSVSMRGATARFFGLAAGSAACRRKSRHAASQSREKVPRSACWRRKAAIAPA